MFKGKYVSRQVGFYEVLTFLTCSEVNDCNMNHVECVSFAALWVTCFTLITLARITASHDVVDKTGLTKISWLFKCAFYFHDLAFPVFYIFQLSNFSIIQVVQLSQQM